MQLASRGKIAKRTLLRNRTVTYAQNICYHYYWTLSAIQDISYKGAVAFNSCLLELMLTGNTRTLCPNHARLLNRLHKWLCFVSYFNQHTRYVRRDIVPQLQLINTNTIALVSSSKIFLYINQACYKRFTKLSQRKEKWTSYGTDLFTGWSIHTALRGA